MTPTPEQIAVAIICRWKNNGGHIHTADIITAIRAERQAREKAEAKLRIAEEALSGTAYCLSEHGQGEFCENCDGIVQKALKAIREEA